MIHFDSQTIIFAVIGMVGLLSAAGLAQVVINDHS